MPSSVTTSPLIMTLPCLMIASASLSDERPPREMTRLSLIFVIGKEEPLLLFDIPLQEEAPQFPERWKGLNIPEPEGLEEVLGGAVEEGFAGDILLAEDADQ